MARCCADCKYFVLDDPEDDEGECLRYPPRVVEAQINVGTTAEPETYQKLLYIVPQVAKKNWCGEFSLKD